MPKRRSKGRFAAPKQPTYDSDDERAYRHIKDPDPESREYMYDEVDEFHANKEKILLDDPGGLAPANVSSEEEEVYALEDDDDDDEDEEAVDMSSDELEGQDKVEIPDSKSWGKKKSIFYTTDYVDDDLPGVSGSEEEDAREEEEKEALALQQKMAETLQEEDFGYDFLKTLANETPATEEEEVKVIKDMSKFSKHEKLELLKKESPELLELIEDFKLKIREVIEKFHPLMNLVKEGKIRGKGATYVETKYLIYLTYCINISYYMILKSSHISVNTHPVIRRLVTLRNTITQLKPLDIQLEGEIESLLSGDTDIEPSENKAEPVKKKVATVGKKKLRKEKKQLSTLVDDAEKKETVKKEKKKRKAAEEMFTTDEREALNYYTEMKTLAKARKLAKDADEEPAEVADDDNQDEQVDESEAVSKRAITYQISKNKGLTPKRKKIFRNPRVKHREKFRKAKIRRKGQVREVRRETERYGGEASGIKAGVIKSIKIKT